MLYIDLRAPIGSRHEIGTQHAAFQLSHIPVVLPFAQHSECFVGKPRWAIQPGLFRTLLQRPLRQQGDLGPALR